MISPKYSIIIPVFNEQETLAELYRRLTEIMSKTKEPYELLFINDGSDDQSKKMISEFAMKDPNVKVIHFSRNFGHQIAITAGIDYAQGEAGIIIDADLQDPPEIIELLISKWKEGNHIVYGRRSSRVGESYFKKVSAALFYRFINKLSTVPIPLDAGDFRLMDHQVMDALRMMKEKNRFIRGLTSWIGFKQVGVDYVRDKRYAGNTKYSLRKMLSFALSAVISFSYKPLRMATYLGFISAISGFLYLLFVLYQGFFLGSSFSKWTSLIAITLFFDGMILLMLGIIGEYIGRIFTESKDRPLYIVESRIGWEDEHSKRIISS